MTLAFTARGKHKFTLLAKTEWKLHCDVRSRKLEVTTEGPEMRTENTKFKGGLPYVFCYGIHDSNAK